MESGRKNKRHGKGTLFKQVHIKGKFKQIYDGNWHQDTRHGHGIMSEGINYYNGSWENDKFNGFGIYKRSGRKMKDFWTAKGNWHNNKSK